VPLETFRLFTFTLGVHWEAGGNLAPALATAARAIRDRIELSRRIRSQAVEARFSVLGVLGTVYGLGYITWRATPDRVEGFLATAIGTWVIASAILLQATGLYWMSRLTRMRT
jgi:Flp pilus assembly protein TadB